MMNMIILCCLIIRMKKAKYNHMELRNMMEYLDFKDAKELRSKTEIKTKK